MMAAPTVAITAGLSVPLGLGAVPARAADLDGDGVVGVTDFLLLLANWTF